MSATVHMLPIWKANATAAERLHELAIYAEQNPERFKQFVICYKETLLNGKYMFRNLQQGCNLPEEIGMYEIGKAQAMEASKR